jgi:hypothetical protein
MFEKQERWAEAAHLQAQTVDGCRSVYGEQYSFTKNAVADLEYLERRQRGSPEMNQAQAKPAATDAIHSPGIGSSEGSALRKTESPVDGTRSQPLRW